LIKQFPEAFAALEKARSLDNNPSVLGYLGFVYAAAGKKPEAQRVLDQLKGLSKQRHVPPYSIAIIYAGLNDKDQAFAWLNKAFDDRSFFIALLKVEITLDKLRPDPRFNELLKRATLPE
jgi:tetratricopeptide (TPR) repeat protein